MTNLPAIDSRVRLVNPRSNLDGAEGTVLGHQTFGGVPLIVVLFAADHMPVACSVRELQPLDPARTA
jgi:hypothetical protein